MRDYHLHTEDDTGISFKKRQAYLVVVFIRQMAVCIASKHYVLQQRSPHSERNTVCNRPIVLWKD